MPGVHHPGKGAPVKPDKPQPPKPAQEEEVPDPLKKISDFLKAIGETDAEIGAWLQNVGVDGDGNFVHDIDVDQPTPGEVWTDFSEFSSDVLGGQTFYHTATTLNSVRVGLAISDYNAALATQEEVGVMFAEFEGFLAAVRTKDPEAVKNTVNSTEDKKVIAGLLILIAHQIANDPNADVEALQAAADTLMKLYEGKDVSKEELVKLEPVLESFSYKLFPHSVRPEFVADLVKNGKESLARNQDLYRRTLG